MTPHAERAAELNHRRLCYLALSAWLLATAWFTLRPLSGIALAQHQALPITCLVCGPAGATDVVLNLLLFIPLGFLGRQLGWRLSITWLFALLLSLGIESSQYFLLPGRDASLSDLLCNSTGAALGWTLLGFWRRWQKGGQTSARRLSYLLLTIQLAIWLGTAWLLQPALTSPTPWSGSITRTPNQETVTLERLVLDGHSLGVVTPTTFTLKDAPLSMELQYILRNDPPPGKGTQIAGVRAADQVELITAQISSQATSLGLRLNGSRVKLKSPDWAVPTQPLTGFPVTLLWRWDPLGVTLERADAHRASRILIPYSVTLGWSFLNPFSGEISPRTSGWTLIWVFGWLGLLGWWAVRLPLGERLVVGLGGLGVLALSGWLVGWPLTAAELLAGAVGLLTAGGVHTWLLLRTDPRLGESRKAKSR